MSKSERVPAKVLRQRILDKRGLTIKKEPGKQKQLVPVDDELEHLKTDKMRLIESRFGVPIDQLIMNGTIYEVASKLDIDPSTVYKWRVRLELI